MSGCIERHQVVNPMTGSTITGHLQPQEEEQPSKSPDPSVELVSPRHRRLRQRMTPVPPESGSEKIDQPIQLTPLWEHVVRTQQFPPDIDKQSTFSEITERLRDPEWEVRQHALRVLIDVLPTLPRDQVDDIVGPVVPELINNLGHLAPAVRKGALDALRVYLVCSDERERIVQNILQSGLSRSDPLDAIQISITQGLILSTPSLLYPSPAVPPPSDKILKTSITTLANHLIQVTHQEAALKSLIKIRDSIGLEKFNAHLGELNPNTVKDFQVLCEVYRIEDSPRKRKKRTRKKPSDDHPTEENRIEIETKINPVNQGSADNSSRVVLETEIKLNEETAITMTILEQKEHLEYNSEDSEKDDENSKDSWIEKRKTPRRVHFGGEVVKLRTPDSDDSEMLQIEIRQTKIPLPIAPTTKMPVHLTKKSLSNPSSPNLPRSRDKSTRRRSRSASVSPKRGFYVHDGSLSPKKGILTKTNGVVNRIKSKSLEGEKYFNGDLDQVFGMKENDRSWSFEIFEDLDDEIDPRKILNVRQTPKKKKKKQRKSSFNSDVKIEGSEMTNELHFEEDTSESRVEGGNMREVIEDSGKSDKDNSNLIVRSHSFSLGTNQNEIENEMKKKSPTRSPRKTVYESFPRQERNYILMELSSPVKMSSKSREVSPEVGCEDGGVKEDTSGKENGEMAVDLTREKRDKTFEEREKNGETDGRILEPNWEDLGLVTQDVLDDLHNKEDWRARVRGLERVASALRTSSALVAIEPRLGSLLQTVLGGERSCRVAAAAMSVARVVIAGVSEEALKRRLSQVAWGLSRQGGPNAAQLARIAMLRLRPALFLEQLLQPHCIEARNAKTRENALQLLIFSLVTFPSTEFKVENVANKVALMVADRRRRVRQAALDTLAVLAQIYEPEEVLQAGNRAAKQLNEGTDMVAAIRARLARKSLPMVSADGLVVYGLQISPTVQIATGPDVDWIVAGSGSVSPGTGRARGQVIPPNIKGGLDKNKNEPAKSSPSPKPNFIALGVGLNSNKNDRPVAWQLVPPEKDESNLSQEIEDEDRNESALSIETSSIRSRYDDTYSPFISPSDNPGEPYPSPLHSYHLKNDKDVIMKQRKTEENFHRRMDQIYAERREDIVRLESRIPVPQFRDRQIIVRHSTAYQRRRRDEGDECPPSSAPHSSAMGSRFSDFHESDISRRYRSDRIKYSSRPASEDRARDTRLGNSPIREGYESVYQGRRRRSSAREDEQVDTRRNSSSHERSIQPAFSQVQESDLSTRVSRTPSGEKTNLDEDENNEKNLHYVSAQETPYRIDSQSDQVRQRSGADHVPYEVSSESSNVEDHGTTPQDEEEPRISGEDNEPISRRNSFGEKSFDIITNDSNPSRRNSIERAVSVNILSSGAESTDLEKELSSSEQSGRDNDSDDKTAPVRLAMSASSVVSSETNSTDSTTRISGSPVRTNGIKAIAFDHQDVSTDTHDGPDVSMEFDRGYSTELKIDIESRVRASIYPETKTHFQQTDFRDQDEDRSTSSLENIGSSNLPTAVNSVSIVVASRPNSRSTTVEYREEEEPAFQPLDYRQPHADENTTSPTIFQLSRTFEEQQQPHSIDVTTEQVTVATSESFTELPNVPEIHVVTISSKLQRNTTPVSSENVVVQDVVKIHEIETTKRLPSRVPRSRIKSRPGLNKVTPIGHHVDKTPARSKPVTAQCISLLESNDWETTIRGLKSLSNIARQTPEQLDTCPAGTVGRLLGRHIRNLRSQVARTACLAAGDVFTSQARCIDQDLDDIAGPLLQRTADTNKFLRADSNAALDRMIEHIPPHKTITVIVHRGASHQNAIVRAATARLLASLVDRVGPDLTMSLPRDVRDKLFGAGAKLLMDGNLDARNYAKMMFKRLSRCDGFRRALTDAVPETTLRHIDKTLRSL